MPTTILTSKGPLDGIMMQIIANLPAITANNNETNTNMFALQANTPYLLMSAPAIDTTMPTTTSIANVPTAIPTTMGPLNGVITQNVANLLAITAIIPTTTGIIMIWNETGNGKYVFFV